MVWAGCSRLSSRPTECLWVGAYTARGGVRRTNACFRRTLLETSVRPFALSNTTYYLVWLAAGLLMIAALSAVITWHLRWRAMRRVKAAQLLEALEIYTAWIGAQRQATLFGGDAHESESPLREARLIQREWFPELSAETAELFDIHARLINFLWAQQMLRMKDAEAWLESDYDTRFVQLWRLHRDAAGAAAEKLAQLAGANELAREATLETGRFSLRDGRGASSSST